MPVRRPFVLVAAAAFLIAPALRAQQGGLSLDQAIEIALAGNPDVLAAKTRLDAARGRTLQLSSRPEPQVLASVEGIPLPGLHREGDETEIRLGIEQVFEYPGKRGLRHDLGRQGEEVAAADLDRVRLILTARVKRAYWTAAFSAGAVTALESSAVQLAAMIEDLQSRYRAGTAAYVDLLRAKAEKARLRNQILDQVRERRAAELTLDELLGRGPGELVTLTTALSFVPLSGDVQAYMERARASLPAYRLSHLRAARAETAVRLAGLARRPDFLAGIMVPSMRASAWGISFGLTMPFLRPGRAKGAEIEATAEAEAAGIAAASLERRVRTAVESALAQVKSAGEQVAVYENSLLRELEDELGIQIEYFRYGQAEVLGLLDLHRTYVLAQVEHLRALLLYNLALADLEVAGESEDRMTE
jgi:cobalt-zinc-cadmium efflux system outer membrane protein